jgi:prepilin-type N-terminal cleavage/methylation domain-containing protein
MSRLRGLPGRLSQQGFTLVELVITSAIIAAALAGTLAVQYRRANYATLDAAATAMNAVGNAIQNFESHYATQLVAGTAIPGVVDEYHPMVAELTALGYMPPGFDATKLPGGDMSTTISLIPAGCAAINIADCNLYWFTVASKPFLQSNGVADEAGAGRVVSEIGTQSGYSHIETPGFITGYNNGWGPSVVNPTGLAGIVAVQGGYGASELAQYLRIDGGNAMTADFHGGSHDLTGVNNATVSQLLHVQGLQQNDQSLTVGSFVQPSSNPAQLAAAGNACSDGSGAIRADSSGNVLSCKGGIWQISGAPSGTPCGAAWWDNGAGVWHDAASCQGQSILYTGCPAGYGYSSVFAAYSNWMYTCIKT